MSNFLPSRHLPVQSQQKNTLEKGVKIFSKLTIKTQEWCLLGRSSVFIVNFEHISHLFLFPLMTFSMHLFAGHQQCNL